MTTQKTITSTIQTIGGTWWINKNGRNAYEACSVNMAMIKLYMILLYCIMVLVVFHIIYILQTSTGFIINYSLIIFSLWNI